MSNLVSISIQSSKSLTGAISHNRQHKKLDYVDPDGDIFTYETSTKNLPNQDVFMYEQNQINELKELIKEKTGRASQVKNFYVDGLISLGRDQFTQLDSIQKEKLINKTFEFLREEIRDKLQTQVKVCSFHFDEGHKDENGEWIANPHIQFTFENVNRKTGKTIQRTLTKTTLKSLQTKVAEYYQEFGFTRGKDYKEHGEIAPKQVYWKDYKRHQQALTQEQVFTQLQEVVTKKQELTNELAKVNEVKEQYKVARDRYQKNGTATQKQYQDLNIQYNELQCKAKNNELTIEELKKHLKNLEAENLLKQGEIAEKEKQLKQQQIPTTITVTKEVENPLNINLQRKIDEQATKIDQLNQEIKTQQATISDFEVTNENLRKQAQLHLQTLIQEQNLVKDLEAENSTLKKALKNAVDAFLEAGIVKGITNTIETLLERLNEGLTAIPDLLSQLKTKNSQKQPDFSTNSKVLECFAKIDPELVEKFKIQGYAECPGELGYVPKKLNLAYEDPKLLVEILKKATGHEVETEQSQAIEPENTSYKRR